MINVEEKRWHLDRFQKAALYWNSLANQQGFELNKQLLVFATILLPLSASIVVVDTIQLRGNEIVLLIIGWIFLFLSIIFGLIQIWTDARYFIYISNDSSKREWLWSQNKDNNKIKKEVDKLGSVKPYSPFVSSIFQAILVFSGMLFIMLVAVFILGRSVSLSSIRLKRGGVVTDEANSALRENESVRSGFNDSLARYFPIRINTLWEYEGTRQELVEGEMITTDLGWGTKVISIKADNGVDTVSVYNDGYGNDWREDNWIIDNDSIIFGSQKTGDTLTLSFPLVVGQRMGDVWELKSRNDGYYVWEVEEKMSREVLGKKYGDCFRITFKTLPDTEYKIFCYGIGVVEEGYKHNGSINVEVFKLISFEPGISNPIVEVLGNLSRDKKQEPPKLSESFCDEFFRSHNVEPVTVYRGKPAPVNFSSLPEARLFYTTIREQAAEGPNFAGHFTLAGWGCGTDCAGFAIIDAITGKVVFYEPTMEDRGNRWDYDLNSRILVNNPKSDFESYRRKSLKDIFSNDDGYEISKKREYFEPLVNDDGTIRLHGVCEESVLDGLYVP